MNAAQSHVENAVAEKEEVVLCPGQGKDNFGDGDCDDHPDWCSCPAAKALCAKNKMNDKVLCPGQDEDNFCDGDGDCKDHPEWCSCPEAQALCAKNKMNDEVLCPGQDE